MSSFDIIIEKSVGESGNVCKGSLKIRLQGGECSLRFKSGDVFLEGMQVGARLREERGCVCRGRQRIGGGS